MRPWYLLTAATTLSIGLCYGNISPIYASISVHNFSSRVYADTSVVKQNDEVLYGNGSSGPYNLAWKNFIDETMSIDVDGVLMVRGLDYTINAGSGQITFTKPLSITSKATIHYMYDPTNASPVNNQIALPLKYTLGETQTSSLYLSALYKSTTNQSNNGNLVMGLGSTWQGQNNTHLDTQFMFSPSTSAGNDKHSNQAGYKINAETGSDKSGRYTLLYSRAENKLDVSQATGFSAGNQLLNMGFHIAPQSSISADLSYKQTSLVQNSTGATTETNAALAFTPTSQLKMQAVINQVDKPGGHSVDTTTMAISTKPIKSGGVDNALSIDASQTRVDADGKVADTTKLDVVAKPLSSKTGDGAVTITAGTSNTDGAATPASSQKITVGLKPLDPSGKDNRLVVDASSSKATSGTNVEETTNIAVSAKPLSDKGKEGPLTVTASDSKTDKNDNEVNVSKLEIVAKPQTKDGKDGTIAISASTVHTDTKDNPVDQNQVTVTAKPAGNVEITTGVATQADTKTSNQVTSVQGTIKPSSNLEVMALYQGRTSTSNTLENNLDTTLAKISLKASRTLKVSGLYGENPADNGTPLPQLKRGVGLEGSMGNVGFKTGYDWSHNQGEANDNTEFKLSFGLRQGTSEFTGDYRQFIAGKTSVLCQTTYSLGYKRSLSDRLLLSLIGSLNEYPADPIKGTEYTATANVGIKF